MDYILLSKRKRFEVDGDAKKIPLLRRMLKAAAWSVRWNYAGAREQMMDLRMHGIDPSYTQREWNQTIVTRINEISAQIHKSTNTGGADTLVLSPEILTIFEDLDCFNSGSMMLGNRYEVIVNNYMPSHSIIVCKVVADEEDWFKNNRLMGVIRIDGIQSYLKDFEEIEEEVDKGIELIDKKYLPLSLEL